MTETNKKKKATEAAERRAEELGVDLATVKGTGYEGQITIEDVENRAHARSEGSGGPNNGDGQIAEAIKDASDLLHTDLESLERAVEPADPESDTPLDPDEQNIVNQYKVLDATLAGPRTRKPINTQWPIVKTQDFVPAPPPAEWNIPGPYQDYDY